MCIHYCRHSNFGIALKFFCMVISSQTDRAICGLNLVEQVIEKYLAGSEHVEVEVGDRITVILE